jgi:hypothetical protein
VVRCGFVGVVWNTGVSSGDGVVVTGVVDITVLHTLEREDGALPLAQDQIILAGQFLEDGMQQW